MFSVKPKPKISAATDDDLFQSSQKETTTSVTDIEDISRKPLGLKNVAVVTSKRKRDNDFVNEDLTKSWREVLGNPPPRSKVRIYN